MATSLEQRLVVLEAAAPLSDGRPRMILLTGMVPRGHCRQITSVTVRGAELLREPDEAEDDFIDRVKSIATADIKVPGSPVLAFAHSKYEVNEAAAADLEV